MHLNYLTIDRSIEVLDGSEMLSLIDKNTDQTKSWKIANHIYFYAIFPSSLRPKNKNYRVPLPYARINQLNNDAINVQTKIGIFTHSNERTELLINELIKLTAKDGK